MHVDVGCGTVQAMGGRHGGGKELLRWMYMVKCVVWHVTKMEIEVGRGKCWGCLERAIRRRSRRWLWRMQSRDLF